MIKEMVKEFSSRWKIMSERAQKCRIECIAMESKYMGKSELIYTVQESNSNTISWAFIIS